MSCIDDAWFALPGSYWVTEPMFADPIDKATGVERTAQNCPGDTCDDQDPRSKAHPIDGSAPLEINATYPQMRLNGSAALRPQCSA